MDSIRPLVSGKITLNQHVNRLANHGVTFHIHYWGVTPKHYDNQPHQHSFFEICYVVKGKGTYFERDQSYPLQSKTLFLSRPHVQHQIKSKNGMVLLYVGFECIEAESKNEWIKWLDKVKQYSNVVQPVKENCVAASLWLALLNQAAKPKSPFFKATLSSLAFSLLLSLLQTFTPYTAKHGEPTFPKSPSPLLKQATLYIQDNLSQSLKLADLANYLHISERHLSRIFATELGMSYSTYVQRERIKRGANLLKSSDYSIKEIAKATGFSTVHYFTRVFTSIMGISPGRFRTLYTDETITNYDSMSEKYKNVSS